MAGKASNRLLLVLEVSCPCHKSTIRFPFGLNPEYIILRVYIESEDLQ